MGDQTAVSVGGKDIKQWKWKEIMDLILDNETQKHRNAEAAKEVKLRKKEEEKLIKERVNKPNEKLKPEDAKRTTASTSSSQKPGQKASNQKLKTTTKAKDP